MLNPTRTESEHPTSIDRLLRDAREHWRRNEIEAAFAAAWRAFDQAPGALAPKILLAQILRENGAALDEAHRQAYFSLLTDPEIEPDLISRAGWFIVLRHYQFDEGADEAAIEALVYALESDDLALTLLRLAPVSLATAERALIGLRRHILLSGSWRDHAIFVGALKEQVALNGGAWPFDDAEGAALAEPENRTMVPAYMRQGGDGTSLPLQSSDPVTKAVNSQYESWPYPAWTRVTRPQPRRLADFVASMDPHLAEGIPAAPDILIAGCGTGRQAARTALRYPDAQITAIDISQASLDYARRQCAALGLGNIRFVRLDLHAVAELGQRFHAIHCTGVLHHVSDPEHGLKLLADTLTPGGVMEIMVYNRSQRLMVKGATQFLAGDLLKRPIDDDLLRQVRQRFLADPDHPAARYVIRSRDFATLIGTHDLLLHRHEDPFDIPRIERALERAGLRMLAFELPTPALAARYEAMFPDDAAHRNLDSWRQFETSEPGMSARHYQFLCFRPKR